MERRIELANEPIERRAIVAPVRCKSIRLRVRTCSAHITAVARDSFGRKAGGEKVLCLGLDNARLMGAYGQGVQGHEGIEPRVFVWKEIDVVETPPLDRVAHEAIGVIEVAHPDLWESLARSKQAISIGVRGRILCPDVVVNKVRCWKVAGLQIEREVVGKPQYEQGQP